MSQKGRIITWGDKISKAKKGKKFSKEYGENISKILKKVWKDPEMRQKYVDSHKGFKPSKEHKLKISDGLKRAYANGTRQRGTKTILKSRISSLDEFKLWREQVYKRDNYTCQKCKKVGGKLQAHHIEPFSKLLKCFLLEYSQFSPIEDKETLVRLAITYAPFWNLNNGQTLCRKCHYATSNYGSKCYRSIKK